MKLFQYLFFSLLTGITGKALAKFFDKNVILIADKEDIEMSDPRNISDLRSDGYENAIDLRGRPTHLCVCGCNVWNLKVMFEENQISQYFLDMECASCGSLATAPTPIDERNELDG